MKFEKNNKIKAIILIPFIIVFVIFDILFMLSETKGINEICSIITFSIICPILILVILNSFKDKKIEQLYNKFIDGEKITGFIVSTFKYKYSVRRSGTRTSYGLKVLANNKIYIVDRLENNEYYKAIENKLNNVQISNDIISYEKIPVDIYLKNDDYYVDIESIKI